VSYVSNWERPDDPETVKMLRGFLANAPKDPGPIAPDLLGWCLPDYHYVCASCAGRIMARGCRLPAKSTPVWRGMAAGVCCLCDLDWKDGAS
jgi:hypothetical protein